MQPNWRLGSTENIVMSQNENDDKFIITNFRSKKVMLESVAPTTITMLVSRWQPTFSLFESGFAVLKALNSEPLPRKISRWQVH